MYFNIFIIKSNYVKISGSPKYDVVLDMLRKVSGSSIHRIFTGVLQKGFGHEFRMNYLFKAPVSKTMVRLGSRDFTPSHMTGNTINVCMVNMIWREEN